MKNNKFIVISSLLSILPYFVQAHDHHTEALRPVRDKIMKEFIYRSSRDVAQEAQEGKILSQQFQTFLDTDEKMVLVEGIYENKVTELVIGIANMKDALVNASNLKLDELNARNKACCQNETWSNIFLSAGVVVVGIGGSMVAKGRKDTTPGALAAVGGVIAGGGSVLLRYWSQQEQIKKQQHIRVLIKIEEKLEHTFEELRKKHDCKVPHKH